MNPQSCDEHQLAPYAQAFSQQSLGYYEEAQNPAQEPAYNTNFADAPSSYPDKIVLSKYLEENNPVRLAFQAKIAELNE